jgi:hypothetical protein
MRTLPADGAEQHTQDASVPAGAEDKLCGSSRGFQQYRSCSAASGASLDLQTCKLLGETIQERAFGRVHADEDRLREDPPPVPWFQRMLRC